jgi:hypothetical protein
MKIRRTIMFCIFSPEKQSGGSWIEGDEAGGLLSGIHGGSID